MRDIQIVRSGGPWYGCWDLVAAVWAAITVLGLTIALLADQIGSTVSCQLNAVCRAPAWLGPAAWAAWAGALISVALAIRMALREVESGQGRTPARAAILAAFLSAGFVLLTLAWNPGAPRPD